MSDKMVDKIKMSDKICKYFNTGYGNFTKTHEGCRIKHPTEVCKLTICKENICMKRHPKECRYRSKCKQGNGCFYKHYSQLKTNNVVEDKAVQLEKVTEQLNIYREIVLKIRKEVFELEKQNKDKILLIEDLLFKI